MSIQLLLAEDQSALNVKREVFGGVHNNLNSIIHLETYVLKLLRTLSHVGCWLLILFSQDFLLLDLLVALEAFKTCCFVDQLGNDSELAVLTEEDGLLDARIIPEPDGLVNVDAVEVD